MHALALTSVPALAVFSPQEAPTWTVEVSRRDSGDVVTIRARHAPIDAIVVDLAAQSQRTVEGLELALDAASIDVDLVDRPIDLAFRILLGAAGLRPSLREERVLVEHEIEAGATPEQIDELAEAQYLRALRAFPHANGIDAAQLELGGIQERRGRFNAARTRYDALVKDHPDSEHAFVALLRAGKILQDDGDWNEAAVRFSRLANASVAHPFHAEARLELARSLAHADRGARAISILNALERQFPAPKTADDVERKLVRALALADSGRAAEALILLENVAEMAPERAVATDAREVRAVALEHTEDHVTAARAWLAVAASSTGSRRASAFARAAGLARDSRDAIGAEFIERARDPSGTPAPDTGARAEVEFSAALSVDERLALAGEECALGSLDRARSLIEPLWSDRVKLDDRDLARSTLVMARCVDAREGLEILRASLTQLHDPEDRRDIYVAAAAIHERRAEWELASEAYAGRISAGAGTETPKTLEAPDYCADSVLRAIACFHARHFEQSLELSTHVRDDSRARYWSGRALARLARFDEARAAYTEAATHGSQWVRECASRELEFPDCAIEPARARSQVRQ